MTIFTIGVRVACTGNSACLTNKMNKAALFCRSFIKCWLMTNECAENLMGETCPPALSRVARFEIWANRSSGCVLLSRYFFLPHRRSAAVAGCSGVGGGATEQPLGGEASGLLLGLGGRWSLHQARTRWTRGRRREPVSGPAMTDSWAVTGPRWRCGGVALGCSGVGGGTAVAFLQQPAAATVAFLQPVDLPPARPLCQWDVPPQMTNASTVSNTPTALPWPAHTSSTCLRSTRPSLPLPSVSSGSVAPTC